VKGIVFLDRDGTLIEEVGYLADPGAVREIPGAADALRELAAAGLLLAVVSNQAGVARGLIREEEFEAVHRAFEAHFAARGVRFAAVEYCLHHPEARVDRYRSACACRKPGTGMADRIIEGLGLPMSCRKWVVGDKMSDILMGRRLRAETVLVATGYGRSEFEAARGAERPDVFVPGIREAARWILERVGRG